LTLRVPWRALAVPVAAIAIILTTFKMMIDLGVQRSLGQSLLQIVQ
jgi:hypothetical protein